MNDFLKLEGVSMHFPIRKFGKRTRYVHAMDDVSFSLKKGEILSLVGESGSGKTTTARVIAKVYTPTSGNVFVNGNLVSKKMHTSKLKEYRQRVQMIFQDPFSSLNPTKRVRSILSRPFVLYKSMSNSKEIRQAERDVLEVVGLTPTDFYLDKFPHELSGGQRQRVGIARAISVEPDLILADEPTSMLDVSIRLSIMNTLLKLKEERNISYLYITHDLAGARYVSDRIIVMYAGMIMEIGPAEELIQHPLHPYTQLLKRAAPSPETGFNKKKLGYVGEVPSLISPPKACRFSPRCPFAMEKCSKEIPPLYEIGDRKVRCFLYEKSNQENVRFDES